MKTIWFSLNSKRKRINDKEEKQINEFLQNISNNKN